MYARILKVSILSGLLVGIIVSAVMTFADWRFNPSGLFHNEHGTNWEIVSETAVSWLVPTAFWAWLATAVVMYLVARIRGR